MHVPLAAGQRDRWRQQFSNQLPKAINNERALYCRLFS
jgi:hypothetical protein